MSTGQINTAVVDVNDYMALLEFKKKMKKDVVYAEIEFQSYNNIVSFYGLNEFNQFIVEELQESQSKIRELKSSLRMEEHRNNKLREDLKDVEPIEDLGFCEFLGIKWNKFKRRFFN